MTFSEVVFWVALTLFGTGLYFMLETKSKQHKKKFGLILVCIGLLGMAFSVFKHLNEKAAKAASPELPQQQNTQTGVSNNAGNVNQSGDHNTAVIGNNNKVGNVTNITQVPNRVGRLKPANGLWSKKNASLGVVAIVLGPNVARTSSFPAGVFMLHGRMLLSLDRNDAGLAVTADVFNQNDDIVVSIDKNEYRISDEAFKVEHPDRSTLIVTSKHLKEEVLNVKFVNPNTVRVFGHFRYHGKEVVVDEHEVKYNGMRFEDNVLPLGDAEHALFDFD